MSATELEALRPPPATTEESDSGSDWRFVPGSEEATPRQAKKSRSLFRPFSRLLEVVGIRRRSDDHAYDYYAAATDEEEVATNGLRKEPPRKARGCISRTLGLLKRLPLIILVLFGLLHIILALFTRKSLFWDVDQSPPPYLPDWGKPGQIGEGLANYPTDATRDILPIPCHSHNDYWRDVPLFDAIHAGCTGVEADVWLYEGHEELYVGHDSVSLTASRNFQSLYVNPLVELLDKMNSQPEFNNATGNGVFDEDREQTLVLLVDFKTNGRDLLPEVHKQLEPLREKNYLSYWDGNNFNSRAVTVVGTGNTPFDLVIEDKSHRDIFFDAPLDEMWEPPQESAGKGNPKSQPGKVASGGQGKEGTGDVSTDDFNTSTSYYASVSFFRSVGYPWTGRISKKQLDIIRGQIKGAHRRGLKVRYWETPSWPTSLRNHVWEVLVKEGVDMLNVDDLRSAESLDWRKYVTHGWVDA